MVSPLMSITLAGENRRGSNKYTPVVSPTSSASPKDTRMTPIRKSLFQKRRVTSNKRRKESFLARIESSDSPINTHIIEKEHSSNKKKNGQLKVLQDRFNNIQKGLGSIDEERNDLVNRAKRLDDEKRMIERQLELREHEILTLIKRCASQEEKMRETSKLRSKNKQLETRVESLTKQIQGVEIQKDDRSNLQRMLQESELDREHLRDRLSCVQREHDSIAHTLQDCLSKIRKLTDEKAAIEEERRMERKRTEIDLEQRKLDHENDANMLRHDIQIHRDRIDQMERILQDNMKTNTALRREKAAMSQKQREEIQTITDKFEQEINQLRAEVQNKASATRIATEETSEGFQHEIRIWAEKLRSKESLIEEIQAEFSDQMMKLMSAQSSLEEAEGEKRELELKLKSFETIEFKHAALLDFVEILDTNLADLTTENANLQLEKEELLDEAQELRKKASILQQQCSNLLNTKKEKENDFRALLNTEKEELRNELELNLTNARGEIAEAKTELNQRNERIMKLEAQLDYMRKLVIEKEDEICRILNEMESLSSNLGSDLKKARCEMNEIETEVFAKDQNLASIEGYLEGAKEMREDIALSTKLEKANHNKLEIRIRTLENELLEAQKSRSESMTNLEKARERIDGLERQLIGEDSHARSIGEQRQEEMSESGMVEEHVSLSEALSKIASLEAEIAELKNERDNLEHELEKSKALNAEKDERMVELNNEITCLRRQSRELSSHLDEGTMKLTEMRNLLLKKEEDITNELHNSKIELSNQEGVIEKLQTALSSSEEKVKSLTDSLLMVDNRVVSFEETVRRKDDELESLTSKLREAEQKFSQYNVRYSSEKQGLELKIEALMLTKINLAEQVEAGNEEMKSKEVNYHENLSNLRLRVDELEKSVASRDQLISSLQENQQNEAIKHQLHEAERNNSDLQEKLKLCQNKIEYFERDAFEKSRENIESNQRTKEALQELNNATKMLKEERGRSKELEDKLERTMREVVEKETYIASVETKCENLQSVVNSLGDKIQVGERASLESANILRKMKMDASFKEETIRTLHISIKNLEDVCEQNKTDMSSQNDKMVLLAETVDNLKATLLEAEDKLSARDETITSLENEVRSGNELKIHMENKSNIANEHRKKLELKNEELEMQITEDGQKKENEILVSQLKQCQQDVTSLKEEALRLREELSKQRREYKAEKDDLLLELDALRSECKRESLLKQESGKTVIELTEDIASLTSAKTDLEGQLKILTQTLNDRDVIIETLEKSELANQRREETAQNKITSLERSAKEASNALHNLKAEYESELEHEKRSKDAKIKESQEFYEEKLNSILLTLQETERKLEESENLLAEKSSILDELEKENRDINIKLKKEESESVLLGKQVVKQHGDFEAVKTKLLNVQNELQVRETILTSELDEERKQKLQVEEALKSVTKKFQEASVTKKNFDDLKRENRELQDRICRQETYMKRKLEREKAERVRSTPIKGIASTKKNLLRTPPERMTKSSSKILPPASHSRSRLQMPSSIRSTGIPSSTVRNQRISPLIPQNRLSKSPTSPVTSARSTTTKKVQTPMTRTPTLSALDILQSELDDDDSTSSELSSILDSPEALDSPVGRLPDWE